MKKSPKTGAVSPVIGVILMVAVSVGLIAMSATLILDTNTGTKDVADATVNTEAKDGKLRVSVVRNENVEDVKIKGAKSTSDIIDESGETASVSIEPKDGAEVVEVTAATRDGDSEQILETIDTDKIEETDDTSFNLVSSTISEETIKDNNLTFDYEIKNTGDSSEDVKVVLEIEETQEDRIKHSSVASEGTVTDTLNILQAAQEQNLTRCTRTDRRYYLELSRLET